MSKQTASIHIIHALLARRDHSKLEIWNKLIRRFPDDPHLEALIHDCESQGILNDDRFAEHRIRFLKQKGKGYRHIFHDLKQKGIAHEIIAKHLVITDNSWLDSAERLLQKRFSNQPSSSFQDYARRVRFLQQRGFTTEQIQATLRLTQKKWLSDDDYE